MHKLLSFLIASTVALTLFANSISFSKASDTETATYREDTASSLNLLERSADTWQNWTDEDGNSAEWQIANGTLTIKADVIPKVEYQNGNSHNFYDTTFGNGLANSFNYGARLTYPWFDVRSTITAIKLEAKTPNTKIKLAKNNNASNYVFACLDNLKEIAGLNKLDLSGLTSLDHFFAGCTKLTKVDCQNWDISNITSLRGTFYHAESLEALDLSNWDTSKVTDLAYMFAFSKAMQSVTGLNNFKTNNVTDLECLFYASSIANLEGVQNWDTANVTNLKSTFSATNVANLDLTKWNVQKVTNMERMFAGSKFTSLNLSKWNAKEVTSMNRMFQGTKELSNLDISDWQIANVTNMAYMFNDAQKLQQIDVANFDVSKVTTMAHMFSSAKELNMLDVSKWQTTSLTNITHMFAQCEKLTNLAVNNWDVSKVKDMSFAFANTGLTSLDVQNWQTDNVCDMQYLFSYSHNLASLDVSNWHVNNVGKENLYLAEDDNVYTNAEWQALTNKPDELSESPKESTKCGLNNMFEYVWKLKTLDLSKWQINDTCNRKYILQSTVLHSLKLGPNSSLYKSNNNAADTDPVRYDKLAAGNTNKPYDNYGNLWRAVDLVDTNGNVSQKGTEDKPLGNLLTTQEMYELSDKLQGVVTFVRKPNRITLHMNNAQKEDVYECLIELMKLNANSELKATAYFLNKNSLPEDNNGKLTSNPTLNANDKLEAKLQEADFVMQNLLVENPNNLQFSKWTSDKEGQHAFDFKNLDYKNIHLDLYAQWYSLGDANKQDNNPEGKIEASDKTPTETKQIEYVPSSEKHYSFNLKPGRVAKTGEIAETAYISFTILGLGYLVSKKRYN